MHFVSNHRRCLPFPLRSLQPQRPLLPFRPMVSRRKSRNRRRRRGDLILIFVSKNIVRNRLHGAVTLLDICEYIRESALSCARTRVVEKRSFSDRHCTFTLVFTRERSRTVVNIRVVAKPLVIPAAWRDTEGLTQGNGHINAKILLVRRHSHVGRR